MCKLLLFYYCWQLKLSGKSKFVKNGLRDFPHSCEGKYNTKHLYLQNPTFCQGGRCTEGYLRTLCGVYYTKKEIPFWALCHANSTSCREVCGLWERLRFPLGLVKILLLIKHCKYLWPSSFLLHLLCHPHPRMGYSNAPGESSWTFKVFLSSTYGDELRIRLTLRAPKLLPEYVNSERSLENNLQ